MTEYVLPSEDSIFQGSFQTTSASDSEIKYNIMFDWDTRKWTRKPEVRNDKETADEALPSLKH